MSGRIFQTVSLELDFSHLETARVGMPVAYALKGGEFEAPTPYCSDLGKRVRSELKLATLWGS
jgi:hypothetical protein